MENGDLIMNRDEMEIGNLLREGWDKVCLKELDKIMSKPYSGKGQVSLSNKPLPDNEVLAHFLEAAKKAIMENPGIPYCSKCWHNKEVSVPYEINEDGDLECFGCGSIIAIKKE